MKTITDILCFIVVALMMTSWIWIGWLEKPVQFFSNLFVYPAPEDLRFKEEMIQKYIQRTMEGRKEVMNNFSDNFSLSCPTGMSHKAWSPEQKQSLKDAMQKIADLEEKERNKNI